MTPISSKLLVGCWCILSATTQAQFSLIKLADDNTPVPGAPGTTFKDFSNPAIHNGQVIFRAINSSSAPGLYLATGANILKIADTNTAAPNGGNFTNVSFFAYGLEDGAVAFLADDTNGAALFLWTNGVTTRLAKRGDPIPGTATNKFTTFGQPAFDRGAIYFIGADSTNYRGVHRYDGVLSTGLVSSLQTYPTTALPHGFSSQLTVESNRFAVWSYASNTQPNAIFTWTNGVKNFLVSSNDAIPGAGANFDTFQSPPDMRNGTVGFWGGSAVNFQEGIFLRPFDGGTITPLVRRNDPNLGSSGGLTSFNGFSLDNGAAWFYAGGSGGESLFFWQSNAYARVLTSGMKLGSRTLASSGAFVFVPGGYRGGVATFVAKFTDLTRALYITTNLPPATNALTLTLTSLVTTNTPLPGGTGFFTFMNNAKLWQGGVVFSGGGTNSQGGLYRYVNGSGSLIVNRATTYPGDTTNILSYAVNAMDSSRLAIGLASASGRQGLFIYDGSTLMPVVETTNTIPGGSFGDFISFNVAWFNGANLTFLGKGTNNFTGLYEFNGSTLTTVIDSTASFPGTASPLNIVNFARQGNLIGLTANNGVLTSTNGTLHLVATNNAPIPGHPNRVFGNFTNPRIFGGQLYFTAQALSTVDSFSGSYLMRVDADGSNLTVVVDENIHLPGLVAGAGTLLYEVEPSGIFISAGNGTQRALYHLNSGVAEPLFDNNTAFHGAVLISLTTSAGGLSTNGATFAVSSATTSMLLFSPPVTGGTPGGQFTPGSIVWSPGGPFCVDFTGGGSGTSYRIQYNSTPGSTNWVTFTNFTYTGPITICDSSATNQTRLYRAVSP